MAALLQERTWKHVLSSVKCVWNDSDGVFVLVASAGFDLGGQVAIGFSHWNSPLPPGGQNLPSPDCVHSEAAALPPVSEHLEMVSCLASLSITPLPTCSQETLCSSSSTSTEHGSPPTWHAHEVSGGTWGKQSAGMSRIHWEYQPYWLYTIDMNTIKNYQINQKEHFLVVCQFLFLLCLCCLWYEQKHVQSQVFLPIGQSWTTVFWVH